MKSLIKFLITLLQRPFTQKFFENLLLFCLKAMNFGGGATVAGSGEALALKQFLSRTAPGRQVVIFDVGANIGDYTKMAVWALAEAYINNYKIYAFEPSQKVFSILKNNLNNSQNIILTQKALGEKKENLILYSDPKDSGLSSLYQRNLDFVGRELKTEERVEVVTIDEFCPENNVAHVDFLKLDIEGNEFKALSGAKQMINGKNISAIQFEFGGANIDSKTYFKDFYYLLSPNYNIYRILKSGLYPIKEYKEIYEIFITSNYLAVLKND